MEMKLQASPAQKHKHTSVTVHAISRVNGVPYEIKRTVCASCHCVLDEQPLRRAAA
jgi:RNase P subunit RPR2